MQIAKLHIDRFGVWKDLSIGPLASGLNVIWGQQTPDRSAIVEFVRAILFGFDEKIRVQYLPAAALAGGGSLTLSGPAGLQTIHRHDEGDRQGRLFIESEAGALLAPQRLEDLTGGASESLFQQVFTADFHEPLDLGQLLDAAAASGLPVAGGHGDATRLTPLRQRLSEQQRMLADLPGIELPLASLLERRRSLRTDAEALQATAQQHCEQGGQRRRQLQTELVELEQQLEELHAELQSLDAEIEQRQGERERGEQALQQARLELQERVSEKRQRLAEMDSQLERWRHVLRDIEIRRERLLAEHDSADPADDGPADPRLYLRQLEEAVDKLQDGVLQTHASDDPGQCHCRQLRTQLAPALQAMREDIYRLCNQLSLWEANARRSENSGELSQIKRCEAELRQAIKGLTLRRHELTTELAARGQMDHLLTTPHAQRCRCAEHPDVELLDRAVDAPNDLDEELLSVLDAEIARLVQRQSEVLADRADLEDDLAKLRTQLETLHLDEGPNPHQHRLDAKQRELQRIERQICDGQKRRDLQAVIAELEAEVAALESATRQSPLLSQAAELLRRLSLDELQQISITPERTVRVQTRRGDRQTLAELSAPQRDQVYLGLCLALVAALDRQGTHLPLILHDVLVRQDQPHSQAAASLLRDFARRGHQIVMLIGSEQVAELLHTREIPIRRLPDPHSAEAPLAEPAESLSDARRWEINRHLQAVAEETTDAARAVERAAFSAEEFPGELTDRVRAQSLQAADQDDVEVDGSAYFLSESSLIQHAPSIDAATAERFRRIGVLYVRDLLNVDVDEAAHRLRHAGVTAGMIRRWRAEALLVCRVAHLRPYDARILVACGIENPQQLARLDADELRARVESFAATGIGQVLIRSGDRYELARLTDWIDSARRIDHLDGYRDHMLRHRVSNTPADGQPRLAKTRRDLESRQRARRRRNREASTLQYVADEPTAAPRLQSAESAASFDDASQATPNPAAARDTVLLPLDQQGAELRFYLNTADPVENAPSIGPRTAERLERIGIRTVADFLRADAEATAGRLNHRYIKGETVRQWQQQTMLVCCVPRLRGHDAQLLVACGVTTPEQLATSDPVALWARVAPFCETSEGKRVVRGGILPDFAEVCQWVQRASQARQLRAA